MDRRDRREVLHDDIDEPPRAELRRVLPLVVVRAAPPGTVPSLAENRRSSCRPRPVPGGFFRLAGFPPRHAPTLTQPRDAMSPGRPSSLIACQTHTRSRVQNTVWRDSRRTPSRCTSRSCIDGHSQRNIAGRSLQKTRGTTNKRPTSAPWPVESLPSTLRHSQVPGHYGPSREAGRLCSQLIGYVRPVGVGVKKLLDDSVD